MPDSLFKDFFSQQAVEYALYRPVYPQSLFAYLSSLCTGHDLAWDCATGNGQCAIQMSSFFRHIYASDASRAQIEQAPSLANVQYVVEAAEQSTLPNGSVDLLVVAQALHWFKADAFFMEASRVLKTNGVCAVISYVNPEVNAAIDQIISYFHDVTLDTYWQPENKLIFERYSSLHFPFKNIETPKFVIEKNLSLEAFLGHLRTWSAVQRFINERGYNPVIDVGRELQKFWAADEVKKVIWPLHLIVGINVV